MLLLSAQPCLIDEKRWFGFWNLFWKSAVKPLWAEGWRFHSQEPPFKSVLFSSLTKTGGHNSCESILIHSKTNRMEGPAVNSIGPGWWEYAYIVCWAQLYIRPQAIFAGPMKRGVLFSAWPHPDILPLSCVRYSHGHSRDRTFRDIRKKWPEGPSS